MDATLSHDLASPDGRGEGCHTQIPAIGEPGFLAFKASIEFHAVMVPEDMVRAGGAIQKAVKKYA